MKGSPIIACKYSNIVIAPEDKKGVYDTWQQFIGNSFVHPLSSITIIDPNENIAKDFYSNDYNKVIFNCFKY